MCEEVTNGHLDMVIVPAGKLVPGLRAEHLATDVEVFVTSTNTKRKHLAPIDLSQCKPLKMALSWAWQRAARTHRYLSEDLWRAHRLDHGARHDDGDPRPGVVQRMDDDIARLSVPA